MSEREAKPKAAWRARLACSLAAALLLAGVAAGWWLPPLAEVILRRELVKRGCADTEIRVASVSPTRAELGPVVLGRGADAFRIETVRLTYSLSGLIRGQLTTITLIGARATLYRAAGAWRVAGLEALGVPLPVAGTSVPAAGQPVRLPFADLRLTGGTLVVHLPQGSVRIPVNGACRIVNGSGIRLDAELLPEGQELMLQGGLDLETMSGRIHCQAADLDLATCGERLAAHLPPSVIPADWAISGKVAFDGELEFKKGQPGPAAARLRSTTLALAWGDTGCQFTKMALNISAPAGLDALNAHGEITVGSAYCRGSRIGGAGNTLADVTFFAAGARRGPLLRLEGALALNPTPRAVNKMLPAVRFEFAHHAPDILGLWSATLESGKPWTGAIGLSMDEPLTVTCASFPAKLAGRSVLSVDARKDGESVSGAAEMRLEQLSGDVDGASIALEALDVQLPFNWSADEGLRTPQAPGEAPPIRWRGLVMQDVRLTDGAAGLSVTESGARFEARLAPENSALAAYIKAQAGWDNGLATTVAIQIPETVLTEKEPLLAPYMKAVPGATFTAEAGGQIRIEAKVGTPPKSSGAITVSKAELRYPAKKFSMTGISASIEFERLLPLRTPPAQHLTFTAAEVAGMPVDGGEIVFQIESPASVFIEKGDISWAGGWLHGYAFRFNPAQPEGEVVLYADAIDLSRFLRSFKNFKGQGSGILYGRLPFRVRNGLVHFADGFLLSVPGQPGHLELTEQDWLVTALDQTKMDAATLARVKQALTDFDFSVFRMDLETGGPQGAVLRTRLAGKASNDPTLPPVDLQVNVRGPLDYLFNLGLRLTK